MKQPDTPGGRIRALRDLSGMTQQRLAAAAGLSTSTVSKAEAGSKPVSWDTAVAVARALRADAAAIMGQKPGGDTDVDRAQACIPSLRRVLATYDCPPARHTPLPSLEAMTAHVEYCARLRLDANYARLGEQLPMLIEDLTHAVHTWDGNQQRTAFALLAAAYRCADAIAFKLGYLDLSALATGLIRWAALRSGSDLMVGTAAYVRGQTFLVNRTFESGLRALTEAAEPLARRATTDEKAAAVYGSIHLRAAVIAARGSLADEAWGHMRTAVAMAEVVGRETEFLHTAFGPQIGRVGEITVAVELGDWRTALRLAAGWTPPRDMPGEKASHCLIDLSRAWMWSGNPGEALACLLDARARAPQHVRHNRLALDTIGALLRREQRRGGTVVGLAAWAGVSL